jgi:pimeloyl-ACP methyl ester carboxylesterase
MKKLFFICCFPFLLNACTTFDHKNPYPNIEILQYGDTKAYEFKNSSSDKLIINIEGSGWTSVLGSKGKNRWNWVGVGSQIIQALGDKYTIFIPEKWNWNPEIEYVWNFTAKINYTMDNLLECYLTSINAYLAEHQYSSIILIGVSEGAALLPLIYENIKENNNVTGIVSWGFGGLSLYESFLILKDSPITPEYYGQMLQYYVEMYESNNIDAYINEKYVLDLMGHKPLFDYYVNINIPILFIHGERDFNAPVESTRYIQENLPEKPFEYLYYKDMAHGPTNYSQTMRVRMDIAKWIIKNNW